MVFGSRLNYSWHVFGIFAYAYIVFRVNTLLIFLWVPNLASYWIGPTWKRLTSSSVHSFISFDASLKIGARTVSTSCFLLAGLDANRDHLINTKTMRPDTKYEKKICAKKKTFFLFDHYFRYHWCVCKQKFVSVVEYVLNSLFFISVLTLFEIGNIMHFNPRTNWTISPDITPSSFVLSNEGCTHGERSYRRLKSIWIPAYSRCNPKDFCVRFGWLWKEM